MGKRNLSALLKRDSRGKLYLPESCKLAEKARGATQFLRRRKNSIFEAIRVRARVARLSHQAGMVHGFDWVGSRSPYLGQRRQIFFRGDEKMAENQLG